MDNNGTVTYKTIIQHNMVHNIEHNITIDDNQAYRVTHAQLRVLPQEKSPPFRKLAWRYKSSASS